MFDFDYLIFLGRFQPFHLGHQRAIDEALARAKKVIVLVGSANVARSPRNPFTYDERRDMIVSAIAAHEPNYSNRVDIRPVPDLAYDDRCWIAAARDAVRDAISPDGATGANRSKNDRRIGFVQPFENSMFDYGRMFPEWTLLPLIAADGSFQSDHMREAYLQNEPIIPSTRECPKETVDFLSRFASHQAFRWLVDEASFYRNYKAKWGATPYPVFICTADCVVVQSDQILLIRRAKHPGKGLLALPGGHVDPNERFRDAAIRELREETRISAGDREIPPDELASFIDETKTRLFDDPYRSEKGRVVTQTYYFELPLSAPLFATHADDDAASAAWYDLKSLRAVDFFDDHAAIIRQMIGARVA